MDRELYSTFVEILKQELVPAMGCTEPIAVAYAGAIARETLGKMPEKVDLIVSGNIIKNVKSVIVPNTGGRKGLRTAVCAGICYGKADKQLEAISVVTPEQLAELDSYMENIEFSVSRSTLHCPFDLQVRVYAGEDEAYVHIFSKHTNVVEVSKNGEKIVGAIPADMKESFEEIEGEKPDILASIPNEEAEELPQLSEAELLEQEAEISEEIDEDILEAAEQAVSGKKKGYHVSAPKGKKTRKVKR